MRPWQVAADSQSHAQWLNQVIEWCRQGGWLCTAMHDSRRQHWATDTGFPDVFAVRNGVAVAIELKTMGSRPDSGARRIRRGQREWLLELAAAGIRTYVWFPHDSDAARAVLLEGVSLRDQVMRASISKSVVKARDPRRSRARGLTRLT